MKKHLWIFSLLFFCASFVSAQRTVTGTIVDDLGDALIGANVIVKGTTIGTVTDIEGNYSLNVPAENNVLEISYTGYTTKEITLGSSNVMNIVLSEGVELTQVVVTGYGTTKRSDLVQSISTVSGDEITNIPIASVDNLLQGRSTGVEVTAINGKPGQNGYVRIRGLTSVNGNNDPLFVVDGVPVPTAVYSAINPNDIASFSILKDAAATSIYGARASAGVVLITTKTGTENSYIEYSLQVGSSSALDDKYELMNVAQKINYEQALGIRGPLSAAQRADLIRYGTDWEDVLLRDAGLVSHNLSFSGGSAKGNYFLSASRFDNQGLSNGSDFDRTTAKFNGGYQINDRLKVSNALSISRRNDNELRDRNNVQSPFVALYRYNPYETIYNLDQEGNIIFDDSGDPSYNFTSQGFSIVEAQVNNPESRQWTDIYGNVALDYTLAKGLTLRSVGGFNFNSFKNPYFIKPGSILDGYVGDPAAPGIKSDRGSNRDLYVWTNTAEYDYAVDDRNNVTLLVGTEYLKNEFNSYRIDGKGFPIGLTTQDVAAEITDGNTFKSEYALFSTFGRVNYSLDNSFNVMATVRRDGSSRFGADKRFGTFWSVGAGYDFAKQFLTDNNFVDQLKIRASYGTTGNEPTSLYGSIGTLGFASYADQTAAFQTQVANPDLQWETQRSVAVGIDFGVLNNKVTGSLEYYSKNSTGLLFPEQLSRTTGFGSRIANIGDVKNSGFEAELYYSPIRGKDFTIDFGIRFSTNKTKVENINSSEEINPDNAFGSVLKEGEAAYTWKIVEFSRVNPENGDLLYFNADGEETNSPTESDSKILSGKTPLPTFWGGFDVNIGFKGLQLATQFAFKGGNYIYNQRRSTLLGGINQARTNQLVEALDYWKEPGDITDVPRPDAEVEASVSTRFLEKGDFIRLRNVRLSYQVPLAMTENTKLKNISVFIAGSNLLTFTKFNGDPEVGVFIEESTNGTVLGQLPGEYAGFSYPNAKSFTGGITVRF